MKIINAGISLFAAALLGLTAAAQAEDPLTKPITFDPQGTGGDNGITISGFDWAVNSLLTVDAIPLSDGTTTLQSYLHTAVQAVIDPDGNPKSVPGLNADFEITHTGGLKYVATVSGNDILVDTICPDQPPMSPLYCENDIGENFFRMFADENVNSDTLSGDGYADGKLILDGLLVTVNANSSISTDPLELLDSFGTDNWGGTTTVTETGALQVVILVSTADPDYFPDLKPGSLIPYSTETVLSFKETNPSRKLDTFDGTTAGFNTSDVGNTNGFNGPDFLEQTDPNNTFSPQEPGVGCRVTGGGNESFGLNPSFTGWDGSTASSTITVTETVTREKGNSGKFVTEDLSYTSEATFGGQAGANTANQPQPKGELEHVQHSGPEGQWAFHMGTASAPPGTEVDIIQCSDPGWCRQARPAPAKQIDFAGIGTFRNIIDQGNLDEQCASVTKLKGKPSERSIGTYNWAEYHIEDHGERGREGQQTTATSCPADGTGTDAFSAYNGTGSRVDAVANGTYNSFECKTDNDPTTECPDFYRIRIYCGVEPTFDADGNLSNFDEITAQKANGPIYEMKGYIDGGNWQIHPQTGFDLR